MSTSKQLITALEKSDWLDRMLLLAGLAFFMLTVAFVLKQRIIDRGLRIAFFWTRFVPGLSTSKTVLKKAGSVALEKAERGEVTVQELVGTVTGSTVTAASSVLSIVATATGAAMTASTSLLVLPNDDSSAPTVSVPHTSEMAKSLSVTSLLANITSPSSSNVPEATSIHDEL
jgi:protein transport protein SEC20